MHENDFIKTLKKYLDENPNGDINGFMEWLKKQIDDKIDEMTEEEKRMIYKNYGDVAKIFAGITEVSNRAMRSLKKQKTYDPFLMGISMSMYGVGDIIEAVGAKGDRQKDLVGLGAQKIIDGILALLKVREWRSAYSEERRR